MTTRVQPSPRDAARVLVERVEKEVARHGTAGTTTRVGGIAILSVDLERLLRAVLYACCDGDQAKATASLDRARARDPSRATAGELAQALAYVCGPTGPKRATERAIWKDLNDRQSAVRRAIDLRNRILHGEDPPSDDEIASTLRRLAAALKGVL